MLEDYQAARKQGLREFRKAQISGKSPYLPVLDDILREDGKLAEIPVGLVEIPLSLVVGTRTAGRTTAFAGDFMPILKERTEFAQKWGSLYDSQMEEGIRDPIKCYEYLNKFYVEEGNKRVSVSKYVGADAIMADVTRVLPRRTNSPRIRAYYEFLDFYKVTNSYQFVFTREGAYRRFAKLLGQNLTDPWPEEVLENAVAGLAIFEKAYKEKGGEKIDITVSDAFLVYLMVYPVESLLNDPVSLIQERMDKIWNEFLTDAKTDKAASLVENPEDAKRETSLLDAFKRMPGYNEENPLKIAFLYDKSADTSGWIYGHELGRNHLGTYFGKTVDTTAYENLTDDEALRKAIDACAANEENVIFTTSPLQMEETMRSAIHYPKMHFLNCSIYLSAGSVRTYYARMFEAKFIMGALAASVCQNHRIGYLADYPVNGNIANINAFAIGAAMVDPYAKIELVWSSKKDIDWRDEFRARGITVISGPDFIRPDQASREYGIYTFGEDGSIRNLAAPVWDWGRYYEKLVRAILEGRFDTEMAPRKGEALNYWWGMGSGVIDVLLSDHLPYYSKKLARCLQSGIVSGSVNPFDGELRSQEGIIKNADAPRLTSEEIITMNWLNDNVIGEIPKLEELNEQAIRYIEVSGSAIYGEEALK